MNRTTLLRDLGASAVVLLVAVPLCLGVAIASGASPALGIVSGIIGGLIVGTFAGSPLQVTGPAAGLVVSVWTIVEGWGIESLGFAVLLAGLLQLIAAAVGLGRWFRAVSPALIGGMLAGIGVLIATSQLHVMVGASPPGGGVADALALPAAWKVALGSSTGTWAAAVGLGTIVLLVGWERLRPKRAAILPGPLVGVTVATLVTVLFDLPIPRVELPSSLAAALNFPRLENAHVLTDIGFLGAALALGIVAAAESLLCASATDRLHEGPRTKYNKELFALGLGNMVAGFFGALPVTGVIVRSAANIQAGAKTRAAAIIQGALLLGVVGLVPALLTRIPIAALAGTLVYVGTKLFAPKKLRALHEEGQGEAWVFVATVGAIVFTGLLSGIAIGLAISLLKLLYAFSHLEIDVQQEGDRWDVNVHGAATFVQLPRLAEALERIPESAEVHVHVGGLAYIDHACADLLRRHEESHERAGGRLVTEWDEVQRLRIRRPLRAAARSAAESAARRVRESVRPGAQ